MNAHERFPPGETVGFGAPRGIDPHCFEVVVPPGSTGEISILEHFGVAAGAFGRPAAERCFLSRKAWIAIRDDVKRHFNERLKDKQLAGGAWKSGVTKLERLLGQELLVLAWSIEAADTKLIPIGVRNWLALRPEERWWLYAVTAASTGEGKHREIGWRKALRFALTENPVRETLARSQHDVTVVPRSKGRRKTRSEHEPPMLPGFEEPASPFAYKLNGANEGLNASTALLEGSTVSDRASHPGSETISRGTKGKKRRIKPDAHSSGLLLEGTKTANPRKGMRPRRAPPRNR